MQSKRKLKVGSTILTIGYIGLSTVSFVLAKETDLTTANGRHLLAGALANGAFCFSQIMITNFALRKGEKWAWWANLVPAIGYGLTILLTDAFHVSKDKLFITLAPQIGGMIILGIGLSIAAGPVFKK